MMRWKNHKTALCCLLRIKNLSTLSQHSLTIDILNSAFPTLHQFHHCRNYSTEPFPPLSSLSLAEVLHSTAIKNGSSKNLNMSNYIMNLYVKHYDLSNAQILFDEILQRDVRSWTILISGFTRYRDYGIGLGYFVKMLNEGIVAPNEFTLSSVFKCCSSFSDGLRLGMAIHGWIINNGIGLDVALENAILDFYVKCGSYSYAERFFEMMGDKDVFSWNIMMTLNLMKGDIEKCLDCFRKLPNKEVSSWNTVLDGILQHGFEEVALELLRDMIKYGPAFDAFTFSIVLALLSSLRNLALAKQVHGLLLRVGKSEESFVRTGLVDMYCKCGQMEKAKAIFQIFNQEIMKTRHPKISYEDLTSQSIILSTIIAGYVQNGMLIDALQSFRFMVRAEIGINVVTLTSIVTASANAGLLEVGQQIQARILKSGYKQDVVLSSAMVDMYAKCGKLDEACSFFIQAETRNVVLWTIMISAYAIHGFGEKAVHFFDLMRNEGVTPNEVTFIGVLTGCSHAGLIQEGCKYFKMMKEVYGIKPGVEHFTCMVDLYGRAGKLNEIKDFISENDISHLSAVWTAFLSACHLHENMEMAQWVSKKLLELQPSEAGPYILLSNTCSEYHIWDEAANLRGLMQKKKVEKRPGQSWL